jgi:hypothetical protein
MLAEKLTIPVSSLPRQLSTYHTFLLCTAAVQFAFTEMHHYKNCNVPENDKQPASFSVCLYVSGTGSDQVSLSQHKYFLFGELLKFCFFFDGAYCKKKLACLRG